MHERCDTFVEAKFERYQDYEKFREPQRTSLEDVRRGTRAVFHPVRFDKDDPRRCILGHRLKNPEMIARVFRRLQELATGRDDFCLGRLHDDPTMSHKFEPTFDGQDHLPERRALQEEFNQKIVQAHPGADMRVTTRIRAGLNDFPLPGLRICSTKEEISLDWQTLFTRFFGEARAMLDGFNVRRCQCRT